MFAHAYIVATSILAVLGFISIGLLLLWHYRTKVK